MKTVTITLNPAFDLHCRLDTFLPHHENLADLTDVSVGGKGINISRALHTNAIESTAIVLLGEENKAAFEALLEREGIRYVGISVPGRIRENITLHETKADETRISFRGFSAGKDALHKVEECLVGLAAGDVVTLTGRIAEGMAIEDVKAFCRRLATRGIRLVIDSRSFSLPDLLDVKPWLIKPNEEEISAYLEKAVGSFEEVQAAAKALQAKGIENVMVSFGAKGAYLVSPEGEFEATPPKITARSTVGAGDSAIAGFLAAVQENKPAGECLRYAVAYGSAACLTPGTNPPKPEDVKRLLELI